MCASRSRDTRGTPSRLTPGGAAMLCGVMLMLAAASARAHQDPPGCSATGGDVVIQVFQADETTPHPVSEPISECETICYRGVLSEATSTSGVCAFDGGTLTLTTPDGVPHNVTPAPTPTAPRGIPCIGGTLDDPPIAFCNPETTSFTSEFVCYTVRPQDVDAQGMFVADVDYTGGNVHGRVGDNLGVLFLANALPLTVEPCPADAACRDSFCDPELAIDGRLGVCDFTDLTGTICRQAAPGGCDVPEICVEGQTECPADVFEPPTKVCNPAEGECDIAELCPGNGPACPPDVFEPSTQVCNPAEGECDIAELCPGNGPACPPDVFEPPTKVCNPAEGECDRPELCPGNGVDCPPDVFEPPTKVCNPAEGECDVAELCPGNGAECPPDGVKPGDTPCGSDEADECAMPGHCPGPPDKECVEGEPAPDGTSCSDEDNNVCAPAVCVGGVCVRGEAEVGCGDLPTGPCQVAVDNPPGVFSSLRAAVNAAANGTTITVSGLCDEDVTVSGRENLTIQGMFGATTCPAAGLRPGDLLAALRGTLQIRSSTGIDVRFLNIIEGGGVCVRLRSGRANTLHCNCLAQCRAEGVEVNGTRDSEISSNLIKDNRDDGIALLSGSSGIALLDNVVQFNADDGIDVESSNHLISGNNVSFNAHDGIDMDDSDDSRVLGNDVIRNGCIPSRSEDSGIELRNSDDNEVDGNMIRNNPDGELDTIFCRSGSDGNFGSNVPADSSCR